MRSGRAARINTRRPMALGECDRCGFWHLRAEMVPQYQWGGNALRNTGLVVGRECLDVPQDQYRTPILPPDPIPVRNPRPSPNTTPVPAALGQPLPTSPDNQGFTVYSVGIVVYVAPTTFPPPPLPPPLPPGPTAQLDFSKPGGSQYIPLI